MHVRYTFRKMETSEAVKVHAEKALTRLGKYFPFDMEAHTILSLERHSHCADININAKGILMRGEHKSSDMYVSIDGAINKIEKQLKKHKNRLKTLKHNRSKENKKVSLNVISKEIFTAKVDTASVVERKQIQTMPMTVEEAIIQMDLLNNDFYIFTDADSGVINVIYKRKDKNFGLIAADPS